MVHKYQEDWRPTQTPHIAMPIEMLTKELRVSTTAGTADLTPTAGKRIRVWGFFISLTVTTALTSTLRSTLAFGTGHTTDDTKVLASFRSYKGDDARSSWIGGINRVGEVNEVVKLTNVTFSAGGVITRAVVYYSEE